MVDVHIFWKTARMPKPKLITTEGVAPKDAIEFWQTRDWPSIAPLFDVKEINSPFSIASEIYAFRDFTASCASIAEARYDRSRKRIRAYELDHLSFTIKLFGYVEGELSGEHKAGGRGVYVSDMGKPFHFSQTATRNWTLMIPRIVVAEVFPDTDKVHGTMMNVDQAQPIFDFMRAMGPHFASLPPSSGPGLAKAFLHILALGMDQDGLPDIEPAARDVLLVAERARAAALIDQNLADQGFNAERLANLMGMSRAALYRLFEEGEGVAAAIRERRLDRLRVSLADISDRRPIATKALSCGFASAAQLNRTFRRVHGMTPMEYRAIALAKTAKR
jgi:AraC-like DNA-binding protein